MQSALLRRASAVLRDAKTVSARYRALAEHAQMLMHLRDLQRSAQLIASQLQRCAGDADADEILELTDALYAEMRELSGLNTCPWPALSAAGSRGRSSTSP